MYAWAGQKIQFFQCFVFFKLKIRHASQTWNIISNWTLHMFKKNQKKCVKKLVSVIWLLFGLLHTFCCSCFFFFVHQYNLLHLSHMYFSVCITFNERCCLMCVCIFYLLDRYVLLWIGQKIYIRTISLSSTLSSSIDLSKLITP